MHGNEIQKNPRRDVKQRLRFFQGHFFSMIGQEMTQNGQELAELALEAVWHVQIYRNLNDHNGELSRHTDAYAGHTGAHNRPHIKCDGTL